MTAYLILAAELALGWALVIRHDVAHHGLVPRLAAAAARRPVPPLTPHAAWERDRLSPARRRVILAAAVAADAALAAAWLAGHRLVTLAVLGAAVAALALVQPYLVRRSRREEP